MTTSRLFEVSRYIATEAGDQLKDALSYLSEFVEVTTRNLRNGLTFVDNFDSTIKNISVRDDTETIIFQSSRRVSEVVLRRAIDDTYYVIDSFGWKYDASGNIVVKVKFADTPPAGREVSLVVMLHFE